MIIEKNLAIAKEVDDVALLLVSIVQDIRAGKPLSDIATNNVAKLMDALAGVDQLGNEVKENRKVVLASIGYRTGELADAILGQ